MKENIIESFLEYLYRVRRYTCINYIPETIAESYTNSRIFSSILSNSYCSISERKCKLNSTCVKYYKTDRHLQEYFYPFDKSLIQICNIGISL